MITSLSTPLISWDANSAFITPSSFATGVNARRGTIAFSRPIRQTLSLAKSSQPSSGSPVFTLSFYISPFYIAFFVMSVVVDAIQRVLSRRSPPQCFQKLMERVKTKLYTALTISMKITGLGIGASVFRPHKNPVFTRHGTVAGFTVPKICLARLFYLITSARRIMSCNQIFLVNCASVSAFAQTVPRSLPALADASETNDKESLKILSSKDADFRTQWGWIATDGKLMNRHFVKANSFNNLLSRVVESLRFLRPASVIIA